MIIILKAILGWVILMLVGTNVLGIVVRSLTQSVQKRKNSEPFLIDLANDNRRGLNIMRIISFIICIGYFLILYYFWNIGVVIAAVLMMLARLPDLLNEIETGIKLKFGTIPPKTPWDWYFFILFWGSLPVLWYSLYIIK